MCPTGNTQFTETVTACGGSPSDNGDDIDFSHQVSKAKTTKNVGGTNLIVDSEIDVDLICRYSSTVTVHSDYSVNATKTVKKLEVEDSCEKYGYSGY